MALKNKCTLNILHYLKFSYLYSGKDDFLHDLLYHIICCTTNKDHLAGIEKVGLDTCVWNMVGTGGEDIQVTDAILYIFCKEFTHVDVG